jgi:hypothetical protein
MCAVAHGIYEPWLNIVREGQDQTWLAKPFPENFSVVHFHGTPMPRLVQSIDFKHHLQHWTTGWRLRVQRLSSSLASAYFMNKVPRTTDSNLLNLRHPVFHVHEPDLYFTSRWKALGIIKFLLKHYDFDYLFMTTSSSYIHPKSLTKLLKNSQRKNFYAGLEPSPNGKFASGANRILSRDIAELLIKSPAIYGAVDVEDAALGKGLANLGIKFVPFPSISISSVKELELYGNAKLSENYHFRCKSGDFQNRNDVEIMKALDKRLFQ